MYNRYIPEDMSYTPVDSFPPPEQSRGRSEPGGRSRQAPFRLPDFLTGKEGGGLSGLLKTLRLDRLDSGDILLLLITLYLLVEGDDIELVIALGLVLLMGFGEDQTST